MRVCAKAPPLFSYIGSFLKSRKPGCALSEKEYVAYAARFGAKSAPLRMRTNAKGRCQLALTAFGAFHFHKEV